MVPLTPKGSSNWFIDEVNAAISQGKVCVGFQWMAASGGLLDPASSKLGKTKEDILKKLGFAALPKQVTDKVPLGGMGLHVSKYIPADHQAEALNFIKWFETKEAQTKWAELGGVPARNDVLNSPAFTDVLPYNHVFTESVPRLKDFWNLPEYAKLLNVHSTEVNAAISGTEKPDAALDKLASEELQARQDQGGDPRQAGLRAAAQAGHRPGSARRHGPAHLQVHPGRSSGRGAELHQVVRDA
jgi:multiple sugar transport system substrate-binding protein